jgi:hypothetical protein
MEGAIAAIQLKTPNFLGVTTITSRSQVSTYVHLVKSGQCLSSTVLTVGSLEVQVY